MMPGVAIRAFSYLLAPTAGQADRLGRLLDAQRELYNAALEERRGAWRWERRRVSRYDQYHTLTGLREVRPDILAWGVTVCRGTLSRLNEAFDGFYRRCQTGAAPGFPRFKAEGRWDSVSWPDSTGWKLHEGAKRLYVQGVGQLKVRLHRRLGGTPKTATARREGRKWRVTVFCAGVAARPLPPTGRQVGVDRGVSCLVATSDGVLVENPRHLAKSAQRLARRQRALVAKQRRSGRRQRAAEAVSRTHRKVANQRRDLLHKLSRRLVDDYDLIAIEDLQVAGMTRSAKGTAARPAINVAAKSGLNRSILDAGWGILERMLAYKAEDAGRQLVKVNPRHTSQRCASCGHVAADNRAGADFECTACGHRDHADLNAAINILRAGLAQRAKTREVHDAT